ncbi:MAG: class I SAM-dependent methyltransferase [Chloroflexaceae bacterium]|nr:class I SAM-dependent methyltransferase [Chloroflexaceae bacterium]
MSLEIGYGGGRLLHAACHYFQAVIGIDIHAEADAVRDYLHTQGVTNFCLLQTDGAALACHDASLDFIYSFIVLQHLPSFDVLAAYLREVRRCLRVGGVAQLYVGTFSRLHPLYQLACFAQGYKETRPVEANHISLVVRVGRLKQICRALGLHMVETGTSYFLAPDGYTRRPGGQTYVTLLNTNL